MNSGLILSRQRGFGSFSCGHRGAATVVRCSARRVVKVRASQQNSEGFGDSVMKMAKKIQSQLPIVGLLSRLASPEGGVGSEEQSYQEFCREVFDKSTTDFNFACSDLENLHKETGQRRYVMCVLWMVKYGVDLLPDKEPVLASMRLRITKDLEIEVDRFQEGRSEALKGFTYMERPEPSMTKTIPIAVDALCRLVLGGKEDKEIEEEEKDIFVQILKGVFPEASDQLLASCFAERGSRVGAYD